VPDLQRGGPPPIDLERLASELEFMLEAIMHGDFMEREVPIEVRRLMDIAFSGNGEPTSAAEFPQAMKTVIDTMRRFGLLPVVKLRLISNGSLLHRLAVQRGIRLLGEVDGEVWFKIDRGTETGFNTINRISIEPDRAAANLEICATLAPTWVQTCWFALDGKAPGIDEERAYVELLRPLAKKIKGVHLYGLARPSLQPEAHRLGRLSNEEMAAFAARISALGIEVVLNP
jgi:wyosine [tRNA(Phe)-imidazoG37] synthetase (radical SAM superfamily)